ncbi:MAG TPA: hypothetical protein VFS00_33830 [Polyangiaceae bacterium]|nr:hypothetical protein [Polyangiaceae bacterium]
MLPFRRTAALVALFVTAHAACTAPEDNGLFDPLRGPINQGGSSAVPGCLARCQAAAERCTLIDVPCDSICGSSPNNQQLSCLERAECAVSGNESIVQRCFNRAAPLGGLCDCGLTSVCADGGKCQPGLLCFDPGGPDDATPGRPPAFPGFCSTPCDPVGGRRCPDGFTCRKQFFDNAPAGGAEQFWCER